MLGAAAARELDAVDGRVVRAGQPLEPPERRQPDARLAVRGTREGEPPGQRVVHDAIVVGRSDAKPKKPLESGAFAQYVISEWTS